MPARHILALAALLVGRPACPHRSSPQHRSAAPSSTAAEFETLRPRYRAAIARGRAWLDGLQVDPLELRRHGIKGKKKLVEQLEAYYKLWQVAPAPERAALLARIRQVIAVTAEDRYHDMLALDDRAFKQDATSYLRAARLMDRLGLDTTRYREEIRRIQPRLDAHLAQRGPHQRQVFHTYYQHFGLREPFPLEHSLGAGLIARRPDPARLNNDDVYGITHEIYALYEYGDRLDIDPFDAASKQYLAGTLPALLERYIARRNVDLAAEILECMRYLQFQQPPDYRRGIRFLLDNQNADGSWGAYERRRALLGDFVRQGFYLHTTEVSLEALAAVFDRRR